MLAVLVLAVGAALLTRWFVRRGLQSPWAVRLVNHATDRVVGVVKRPITIAVLDEVADVIQTGHYTKNISDALLENRRELRDLVAEKVKHDPNVRLIGKLPGYDLVVQEVTETTMRVLVEMLADPRMDELVSDLLRNNLQQIKRAVRERQHESVSVSPPDPAPNSARSTSATRAPRTQRGR
ncbi:hypothetical protein D9V37_13160 [Nocardioides mangrovicus]|uniref:NAD-glutamate dehydrogenase n=1 Tax=Nocardioides mangrovicus TaxID=2478913 RepID=A0A3L8P232_9ACTN|nr:hypothetical protein D9V37_13160 [Nocardioides mangrovicus]